ncbi:MAG: hypothetical protein CMF39_06055 [Legionellaceae bacterium]|nr:hypothetical protein [Legionellaceae bacterium]|tara:strand:+ start:296 stop:793 length:498 start_codon:yes stop_codon:yes gene_type:complete
MLKNKGILLASCIISSSLLSGCHYIEKKLHHQATNADYAPVNVKGKSMYASVKKGYLDFHVKVSAFKPKRFKMDFLPHQQFMTYDQSKLKSSTFYEKGVYQYKKNSSDTALLVITTYNKHLHESGYGNFILYFNKPNEGVFTAKLYSPDSNDHYKQSGTFKIADY